MHLSKCTRMLAQLECGRRGAVLFAAIHIQKSVKALTGLNKCFLGLKRREKLFFERRGNANV